MKKLLIVSILSAFLLFSCSNEDKADSQEQQEETVETGERNYDLGDGAYGFVKIDDSNAMHVDSVVNVFESYDKNNKNITLGEIKINDAKMTGKIESVCKHSGCWVTVKTSKGNEILVTFKDHFAIPRDKAVGKDIVFHGTLSRSKTETGELEYSFEADGVLLK